MSKKIIDFKRILSGCQNNDKFCKELLYKQFYGYLKAIILRYTADQLDSEELVNDSFIKIFDNLQTFKKPDSNHDAEKLFKGWAGKIASRTAIDKLRSKKQLYLIDEWPEHEHPVAPVSVMAQLHVADIFKLMQQLPQIQRVVFNLYEVEGFTHDEISQLLQIAESSSRVYLTRAKNKLKMLYTQASNPKQLKNG